MSIYDSDDRSAAGDGGWSTHLEPGIPEATSPELAAVIPASPYGIRTEPDDETVDTNLTTDGFVSPNDANDGEYIHYNWGAVRAAYRLGYADGQDATRAAITEVIAEANDA